MQVLLLNKTYKGIKMATVNVIDVIDGDKNQKEINDISVFYLESIEELRNYKPRKNFQIVGTKAYWAGTKVGGSSYQWVPNSTDLDDGFARIETLKDPNGRFHLIDEHEILLTQAGARPEEDATDALLKIRNAVNSYNIVRNIVIDPFVFTITELTPNFLSKLKIRGVNKASTLKYVGASGGIAIKMSNVAGKANAITETQLIDFTLDLNLVPNVIGIQSYYAINGVYTDNIRIINVGAGGVGLDISKTWYTNFGYIEIRNRSTDKGGIGVRIRGDSGDISSQVNNFKLETAITNMDVGIDYDSTYATHYSVRINGSVELCNIGVRHVGTLGVARAEHFMHFEQNVINVQWSNPLDLISVPGQIDWRGYASTGEFRFNSSSHDVRMRTSPSQASVYMTGSARVAWRGAATDNLDKVNYPGTSVHLITFKDLISALGEKPSNQIYSLPDNSYGKIGESRYAHTSGGTSTIDLLSYGRVISSRARFKIEFLLIQDSDGQARFFNGYASLRNNGSWLLTPVNASGFNESFTLALSNSVLTHTGSLGGYVTSIIIPM